jgi:hypothetical protein
VHSKVILTLFQPEGADYVHHTTASTPGFENLTTSLISYKLASNYVHILKALLEFFERHSI